MIVTERIKILINFILYNSGWFITIIAASKGLSFVGPLCAVSTVVVHLWLLKPNWKRELTFILLATFVGSIVDSLLSSIGYVSFSAAEPSLIGSYPIWMSSLWTGFATTLSLSLRWIERRYVIGAIFGAIGGPLGLYAGVKLGAATFNVSMNEIFWISSIEWAILIPVVQLIHYKLLFDRSQKHLSQIDSKL